MRVAKGFLRILKQRGVDAYRVAARAALRVPEFREAVEGMMGEVK